MPQDRASTVSATVPFHRVRRSRDAVATGAGQYGAGRHGCRLDQAPQNSVNLTLRAVFGVGIALLLWPTLTPIAAFALRLPDLT